MNTGRPLCVSGTGDPLGIRETEGEKNPDRCLSELGSQVARRVDFAGEQVDFSLGGYALDAEDVEDG